MTYKRKTEDEFDLEANYGQGCEVICCEPTIGGACDRRKEYRENGDGAPMRIVYHRVKIAA